MKEIKFNLEIPKDYSFEQLMKEREQGSKFIFYSYLIPLPIFKPIRRISRIYYLKPKENPNKFSGRYNMATLMIGWWGLPFGPAYTFTTIKSNRTGTDITDDIFANLTPQDFSNRQVIIKKVSLLFQTPSKADFKDIIKSSNNYIKKGTVLSVPATIGYYIDTKNPYYIIGLNKIDLPRKDLILLELHKKFYKHVKFEFIDIDDESELSTKLKKQGKEIPF